MRFLRAIQIAERPSVGVESILKSRPLGRAHMEKVHQFLGFHFTATGNDQRLIVRAVEPKVFVFSFLVHEIIKHLYRMTGVKVGITQHLRNIPSGIVILLQNRH